MNINLNSTASHGDIPGLPANTSEAIIVLALTSTSVEQRIVQQWFNELRRSRPGAEIIHVPNGPGGSVAPTERLRVLRDDGRDPWLTPVRVAWRPRERDGERSARFTDVLRLTNPYSPRVHQQQRLVDREPDRCQLIVAEPATVAQLQQRFQSKNADRGDKASDFARFILRQSVLALERAESRRFGERYKLPRLVREEILSSTRFRDGISALAKQLGQAEASIIDEASEYLEEMVATPSRTIVDIGVRFARLCNRRTYGSNLHFDRAELDTLRELARRAPIALLPSHRSYLDYAVLATVLDEAGLPPTAGLGGINLAFWPVGPLLRRAGMVFIRRSFRDNHVYKFVLRQYVGYLAEKRFSMMWSIEGGRTRTGKLGPPKMGLLAYVAGAYLDGRCEDYYLVPLSIIYEELLDVEEHGRYAIGKKKHAENFSWFIRYVRSQRRDYRDAQVHVGFGAPVSLHEELGERNAVDDELADDDSIALQKVAFEVAVRINRATPITSTALITLVLLGAGRALTIEQIRSSLRDPVDFASQRQLPMKSPSELTSPDDVASALASLLRHDVVTAHHGATSVFGIEPGAELAAAYYRNSIIHYFVGAAIAELALLGVADQGHSADPLTTFREQTSMLRDLLKFEFFFPEKGHFHEEVALEMGRHDPTWADRLGGSPAEVEAFVQTFRPLSSHLVLRPYLEAYTLVGGVLERRGNQIVSEDDLLHECHSAGRQFLAQRLIRNGESTSHLILRNGVKTARSRLLLDGPVQDLWVRRQAWSEELRSILGRVKRIGAWADERIDELVAPTDTGEGKQ